MPLRTNKKVTSCTPQIVILLAEDGPNMRESADGAKSKAELAVAAIEDVVITAQAANLGTRGFVYLLSIARYGSAVTPLAVAQVPDDVDLTSLSFSGDPGVPAIEPALAWAAHALELSLEKCRSVRSFDESNSPPPLVALLCDAASITPDFRNHIPRLRGFPFLGGTVIVITCGIGPNADLPHEIESPGGQPDTLNVAPSQLPECLAPVAGEGCFSSPPSTEPE